jgi:PilZ domain
MPKPTKHFEREVRRVRHLTAWITVQDGATSECQVMDISKTGAKIVAVMSLSLPERFQLAFSKGGETRSCEVIWRHGRVLGVKFAHGQ